MPAWREAEPRPAPVAGYRSEGEISRRSTGAFQSPELAGTTLAFACGGNVFGPLRLHHRRP
jgi:hypothetical protein